MRDAGRTESQQVHHAPLRFYPEFPFSAFFPLPQRQAVSQLSHPMTPTSNASPFHTISPFPVPRLQSATVYESNIPGRIWLGGERAPGICPLFSSAICPYRWPCPVLIDHSLPIFRLALWVAKGWHPCVHRVLGKSEHCLVSVKWCREMNHWGPKTHHENLLCIAVTHAIPLPALVSRTGKTEDISLLQNSETLVISISFAHTGQPSSAPPSINSALACGLKPSPLAGNDRQPSWIHHGNWLKPVSYTRWSSSVKIYILMEDSNNSNTKCILKMFAISFFSTNEFYLLYRQPAIAHKSRAPSNWTTVLVIQDLGKFELEH